MNRSIIHIKNYSGSFCGDGDKASLILNTQIDPIIDRDDEVVLDFEGVRNLNSSFTNALIANLVIRNSPDVLEKVYFKNCNKKVKTFVEMAVSIGVKRYHEKNQLIA